MKSLLLLCPKGIDIDQPVLLEAAWKSGANSEEEAYAIAAQAMQIIIQQQRELAIKKRHQQHRQSYSLSCYKEQLTKRRQQHKPATKDPAKTLSYHKNLKR